MASAPVYAVTPKIGVAAISTANTNRTDTGTITSILPAGASGTRVYEVVVEATAAVTNGVVRLWVHNNTANFLLDEVMVSATTPSTTTETFRATVVFENLVLPVNYSLRASTHNAEAFNVFVFGADL